MGILDDLAMGFGFKEKDRDYYDRTASHDNAAHARRRRPRRPVQQVSRALRKRLPSNSRYAAAPNYGTAIGPSLG